jgi:tRNA 2-thiouridine synthesizing protein D
MADRTTLTLVLMDAPYESARSTTALRLLALAVRRGWNVNVFAYEGAVGIPFAKQAPHPNAVHGRDAAQEDHPNPKDWVAAVMADAAGRGANRLAQCGLRRRRGAAESIPDSRGSPAVSEVRRGIDQHARHTHPLRTTMAKKVLSIVATAIGRLSKSRTTPSSG